MFGALDNIHYNLIHINNCELEVKLVDLNQGKSQVET